MKNRVNTITAKETHQKLYESYLKLLPEAHCDIKGFKENRSVVAIWRAETCLSEDNDRKSQYVLVKVAFPFSGMEHPIHLLASL